MNCLTMPIRFQVDPDFYDHPKSIGMSDAATALWVRAGSYSAAKLTDGFVAEHVLSTLSQTPEEASDELRRRGLWHRVKGGFRFHQWGQRNLTRTRVASDLERDRERKRRERSGRKAVDGDASEPDFTGRDTDVERKRRERHAGRLTAGQNTKPQVEPQFVHPESIRNPNGKNPESERSPPVSVSVSVSESESGSGRPPDSPNHDPPPPQCPEHVNDPSPPPCGACADARRVRERWDRDQARVAGKARSIAARRRAEASRAEIDACRMCDQTGYVGGALCSHDPDSARRAASGVAAARNALRKPSATSRRRADPLAELRTATDPPAAEHTPAEAP